MKFVKLINENGVNSKPLKQASAKIKSDSLRSDFTGAYFWHTQHVLVHGVHSH